jgi:hypothetical protein
MRNEIRSVNTLDLEALRTYVDNLSTEAVVDIAFVTDANHNNAERTDLGVGSIKGKSLKNAGRSERIDFIYKPIDINISKYPLPGEFVLVVRTGVGNFYVTTLNLSDNVNNNIDTSKTKGYVRYSEDENVLQNNIKNSNQVTTNSKIESLFSLSNIPKRITNYGDVTFQGRAGNIISLTYSQNNNPVIFLENDSSILSFFNNNIEYSKVTTVDYEQSVEDVYNQQSGNHIVLESNRILLRSNLNGMFFESINSIGMTSDADISLNASQLFSVNGSVIELGGSEATQPIILGVEFSKQWATLINGLHLFAQALSQDTSNILVNQAAKYLIQILNDGISPYNQTPSSIKKFLSKSVYVKK